MICYRINRKQEASKLKELEKKTVIATVKEGGGEVKLMRFPGIATRRPLSVKQTFNSTQSTKESK